MQKALALGAAGALALVLAVTALAGNGSPFDRSANVLTLAVYGDSPYGLTPTDTAQLEATPAFVDSVNADPKVDLVLHVGDIHSGKQYCTEAYDRTVAELWTRYKDPLVYTPGDNEWADCHKAAEGGNVLDGSGNPVDYANGNPVANLALVRSLFFPQAGVTLGGRKKQVLSQAQSFDPAYPSDANFVENVMWEQARTLFVTLDIPGGSNNDTDVWYGGASPSAAQSQEVAERTGADLRWLDAAFAQAVADDVEAVVIVAQADMWDPEKGVAHQAGYEPFVASVASHTSTFGKPVLMFNGDSHVYKSDNPLAASDPIHFMHPSYDVANFHRVVVHGSTFPLEWLRLTVDPRADNATTNTSFGPFSWERVLP
jgi:hypothetical protein